MSEDRGLFEQSLHWFSIAGSAAQLGGLCWRKRRVEVGSLVITTQVGRHMGVGVAGHVWVGVDACSGRAPVGSSGSKEVGGGDRHGWRVWGYKVDLLLVGVVGRHVS